MSGMFVGFNFVVNDYWLAFFEDFWSTFHIWFWVRVFFIFGKLGVAFIWEHKKRLQRDIIILFLLLFEKGAKDWLWSLYLLATIILNNKGFFVVVYVAGYPSLWSFHLHESYFTTIIHWFSYSIPEVETNFDVELGFFGAIIDHCCNNSPCLIHGYKLKAY